MPPARPMNVLIVDDELYVREELRQIDWASINAILVGEADNGEDAYYFCKDYPPDIVITDITMPVMSGLELLQRLKESFRYIQVVLLTCHANFDYARQAIKYGAAGYIPKNMMNLGEIAQTVETCRNLIDKEMSYQKLQMEQMRMLYSSLLRKKLKGEHIPSNQEGLARYPSRFTCIYIENCDQDWFFVGNEVRSYLDEASSVEFWFPGKVGEFLLWFRNSDMEGLSREIKKVVSGISMRIEANLPFVTHEMYYHAVIGDIVGDDDTYITEYRKLHLWREALFYLPGENHVLAESPPICSNDWEQAFGMLEERFKSTRLDSDKLTQFIKEDLYEWSMEHRPNPDALKGLMIRLMNGAISRTGLLSFGDSTILRIWRALRLDQLIDLALYFAENRPGRASKHPYVQFAMQKITERLADPLSLTIIADEAGTTPQYLCRLFVKENGESFNDYLSRKRMEKSMELLRDTSLKVYQIAEKVGIPSYRYFSVLFKEWTGLTPKEYRNQC